MGASDLQYIRIERELTPREGQVLQLLARGASNKVIARALYLSVHTVKRHVARTMLKLHVDSRAEAALLYRSLEGARPRAATEGVAGSVDELTVRERDVLSFVALGASNIEIAGCLALSLNTVKRHTANIREKLGVHSRFHAAALLHDAPQRATAAAPPPG
jgi:DNA-binding NarL/FixJ family response regulator